MPWHAPLLAFAISVTFVPWFQGAATSPRWALAALSLYWLEWFTWPFVLYAFWTLSLDQAIHWTILCAALCWGRRSDRNTVMWTVMAFSTGVAFSAVLAVGQTWWQIDLIPQIAAPAGLFLNKNVMGEAATLALIAMLSHMLTGLNMNANSKSSNRPTTKAVFVGLSMILALTALILSREKAAYLALGVGVLLAVPRRWQFWLASFGLCSLLALKLGDFDFRLHTLEQRVFLWQQAIQQLTWFGNGTYDFATVTTREPNLHNDWLQSVYELGVVGLMVPGVCLIAAYRGGHVFVGALAALASFSFPLHMPASAWFAAFVIGHYLRRDDERRGMVRLAGLAHQQLQRS